eukprot:TRINITY_DN75265_c0_g1_i1.p1 TRINITY_DN75265_c0_g1~~TRINITY_DN75265_c0_g1_i1.p1  ORF type:complete len:311 (-),score=42.28 TRINITY_DN75265_c0_g1_i1:167-1099(-)
MAGRTFIDEHGNIVSRLELTRVDGREVLLNGEQARQEQVPIDGDVESGTQNGQGSFRFHGIPGFRWRSAVGVIVAAQLLVYVVSLWVVTPRGLLSPSGLANFKLGSSSHVAEMCAIRDHFPKHIIELRRWFVPIFLHANPMHIFLNVYFECSSGPRIEAEEGPLFFMLLFFGAGLTGNLLSDAFGVNGVGGSTACYGIIGMDFARWYKKWPTMDVEERESVKQYLLQTCGMLLAWEIIMWKEIDHFGHLGGFIGGFLIVLGRTKRVCLALFALMVITCIFVICIKPLFSDHVGEDHWESACASIWASYRS